MTDFLVQDEDQKYLESLKKKRNEYNGFTFVPIWTTPLVRAAHFNSMTSQQITELSEGSEFQDLDGVALNLLIFNYS